MEDPRNEPGASAPDEFPKHQPTVKELDELCQAIFEQKKVCEEKEALLTIENKKLAGLENQAAAWLDELGREKYQHPALGTIFIKEEWRFSLPQTDDDKQAFFGWLKEQGLYDKYATVNATSYNSLVKREWEIAKEKGEGMHFHLPGVPEPKFHRSLRTLKGK